MSETKKIEPVVVERVIPPDHPDLPERAVWVGEPFPLEAAQGAPAEAVLCRPMTAGKKGRAFAEEVKAIIGEHRDAVRKVIADEAADALDINDLTFDALEKLARRAFDGYDGPTLEEIILPRLTLKSFEPLIQAIYGNGRKVEIAPNPNAPSPATETTTGPTSSPTP